MIEARVTRMKLKIFLFMGITICCEPTLHAQVIGSYIGVGIARTTYNINDMTFAQLPYNNIFTGAPKFFTSGHDATTTKSSWTLYGGYQFSRYLAIEALYQPLGKYSREGQNHGLTDPGATYAAGFGARTSLRISDIDTLSINGFGLTALASLPVANYMFVFGRFGGFYWNGKLERTASGGAINTNNAYATHYLTETGSGFSPMYGIGVRIEVKRGLSIRGEWMHIDSIGGGMSTGKSYANVSSLSAQVNF